MQNNQEFYTLKGYELNRKEQLSSAMEDYLEMICRMQKNNEVIRVKALAEHLHVQPPSVSKMLGNLKQGGYVNFEKYGYVELSEKGLATGNYLLHRHEVLHQFLCALNGSENELEQVEKIEHFINNGTIQNMEKITPKLKAIVRNN